MASHQRGRFHAKDVLQVLDCDESDDGSIDDSDSDDAMMSASEVGTDDSDDTYSSSDDEPLANIASTSAPKRAKKTSPVYRWEKKPFIAPDATFTGPADDVPPSMELDTPFGYFQRFITDDMLDHVVEYSNQYSAQKSGHVANLSRKELEQVIGMFYRMGLVQMAGVRAYWENGTNHEPVSGVMSQNRFQYLLTVLHFVDNLAMTDEDKKADKLWKIRPWLNMMRENCLKVVAHEHNSIDEMMVQYKGKTASIRQYVANKPHPWGFKIWVRAGTDGLVHDFDVYQGGDGKRSELGQGADVVLKLATTLSHHVNYKIFADNLFTGVPLLVKIKELGMHYVGTVRKNRISGCRLEDEKKLRKEGRGAYDHCVEDSHNIIAVRWLDNKAVTLLSTYTGIEPTDTVRRWDSAVKDHREVERPAIIKAYNKFMGGIDLMDSYLAKYRFRLKSRRWYMYLFWHTLMMAIVNAWLVYRREYKLLQLPEKSMMKRQVFQSHVASALVGRMVARPRGRPSLEDVRDVIVKPQPRKVCKGPVDDVRKDAYAHWPVKVQKRGRCKLCAVNNTNTLCEKCNVVRYETGGHFHAHYDSNELDDMECMVNGVSGRFCRFMTILYYLDDDVSGGETAFPIADNETYSDRATKTEIYDLSDHCHDANLVIKPERGKAILWYNHYVNESTGWLGDLNLFSLHGGCEVLKGTKWIANNWIWVDDSYERQMEYLSNVQRALEEQKKTKAAMGLSVPRDVASGLDILKDLFGVFKPKTDTCSIVDEL